MMVSSILLRRAKLSLHLLKQLFFKMVEFIFAMVVPAENLKLLIFVIRDQKVILSNDLAALYNVKPKALTQAVRRNLERFPEDFMFQLSQNEFQSLRSQNVTLENKGKGHHSKYLPYAFTQEGVAMLSTILRSSRAIEVNIAIMRTFVKLRELMISHQELSRKIEILEQRKIGFGRE